MNFQYQRPENALKRAEELVQVNKKTQALDLLYQVLAQRRNRQWQPTHEKVMERFLELCVDARNNRMAKEGLHQYRNLSQQQSPNSLQVVIEYMLMIAEKRVKEVASECDRRALDDVEDLENDKSPESILLASVTNDETKERTEREHLVPWLKFMWESYRSVLEILRFNPKMSQLYHNTARRTMDFCVEYQRNTEFRKLCETLRSHAAKSRDRDGEPDPEVVEMQLATRFEQLNVASELRLWNEGFRTIEDIHGIFESSEKRPSSQLEATYYRKLTDLFLVSENYLFHAYAYKAYYLLSVEKNKSLTVKEAMNMASCVLLSAMSIPLQSSKAGTTYRHKDSQKQKNRKMAQLLGFDINPKRKSILQELLDDDILDEVTEDVKELYLLLECSFSPLTLCTQAAPVLDGLRKDENLKNYVAALERLLIIRVLSQLSQVYYSVRLDHVEELLKPLEKPFIEIENILVKAIKSRQIEAHSMRIDHNAKCIHFGEDIMEEQRTQRLLTDMSRGLQSICVELEPKGKAKLQASARALRAKTVLQHLAQTHQEVLRRKDVIEKRKEEYQRVQLTRKAEVERRREEMEQAKKDAEKARRERQKQKRVKEEMEALEEEKRLFEMKQRMLDEGVDLSKIESADMTTEEQEQLIKDTREKAIKESIETDRKIQATAKRLDTMIRAIREREVPKLQELYEKQLIQDEEDHKKGFAALQSKSKDEHKKNLEGKKRFSKMQNHRKEFESKMMEKWTVEHKADREKRWKEVDNRLKLAKFARARQRRVKAAREIAIRKAEEERLEKERQKQAEERDRELEELENREAVDERVKRRQGMEGERFSDSRVPPVGGSGFNDGGRPSIMSQAGFDDAPRDRPFGNHGGDRRPGFGGGGFDGPPRRREGGLGHQPTGAADFGDRWRGVSGQGPPRRPDGGSAFGGRYRVDDRGGAAFGDRGPPSGRGFDGQDSWRSGGSGGPGGGPRGAPSFGRGPPREESGRGPPSFGNRGPPREGSEDQDIWRRGQQGAPPRQGQSGGAFGRSGGADSGKWR